MKNRILTALAIIFVRIAWLIPGASHRWAHRLKAERKAAYDALWNAGYCSKCGAHFGMHDNSDRCPV